MKARSLATVLLMLSLFLVLGEDALGTRHIRLNLFELTQKSHCIIVGKVVKLKKALLLIRKNDLADVEVMEVPKGKLDKKGFQLAFRSKRKRGLWVALETGQVYIFFLKEEKRKLRLVGSTIPVAGLNDKKVIFVKQLVKVIRGGIEAEKEVPSLLEILKIDKATAKNARYYDAAIDALVQIKAPAIPALLKALEHKDYFLRNGAAKALTNMGSAAVPALAKAMKSDNQQVRRFAIRVFVNAASEHKEVVELFIAEGADANVKDRSGNTPLHTAAHSCVNEEIFKILLANGANANAKNKDGETPLHMAATSFLLETGMGKIKIKEATVTLDKHGAFVSETTVMVVPWDSKKILQLLLAKGAEINTKNKDGVTPLFKALFKRHKGIAKFLIHKGADVNVQHKKGATLLYLAIYADKPGYDSYKDIVELLIAKGADVNLGSPLRAAAMYGHKEIAQVLLAKGAKVDAKDNLGWTPLLRAANRNHKEVVALLLASGADINAATNRENATALSLAASSGYEKIVQLLLAKGADVNAKRKNGLTPLRSALSCGHKKTAELLRKHGGKE